MKKSSRREHLKESSRQSSRSSRKKGGSEGPWEFISSGRLFPFGSGNSIRKAAYRTASGELRFLPL
jgi:hypothetical protein